MSLTAIIASPDHEDAEHFTQSLLCHSEYKDRDLLVAVESLGPPFRQLCWRALEKLILAEIGQWQFRRASRTG